MRLTSNADYAALRSCILANPQEDGPFLVLADWLEEQGDRRANRLRDHIRLRQRLPGGDVEELTQRLRATYGRFSLGGDVGLLAARTSQSRPRQLACFYCLAAPTDRPSVRAESLLTAWQRQLVAQAELWSCGLMVGWSTRPAQQLERDPRGLRHAVIGLTCTDPLRAAWEAANGVVRALGVPRDWCRSFMDWFYFQVRRPADNEDLD